MKVTMTSPLFKKTIPLLFGFSLGFSGVNAASGDNGTGPVAKKLIAAGWDSPNPEALLKNLKNIEATPFDGVLIQIDGKDESGEKLQLRRTFNSRPWKKEWFQKDVELLKAARSKKLTDNFLLVGPGAAIDWFDDDGWKEVVDHWRIAGWIAKEGGLKGLMFDPEIGAAALAFHYSRQAQKDKYGFNGYSEKARQRGREIMRALKETYPDMTLFTLFMNSGIALGALGSDPREGLENVQGYSLYPAFVNGLLDEIPGSMTMVDGAEYAYPHSSELQYLKHANAIRNTTLALVAPENHRKYRAQVHAALAIYLDAYVGFPVSDAHSDVFTDPPLEGKLVDRIQEAVASAAEIADQYVWVWGEQYRWWPTNSVRVNPQSWDEILPGVSEAFREGMDPQSRAQARAEKEFLIYERKMRTRGDALPNIVGNGHFTKADKAAQPLEGWSVQGAITHDPKTGYKGLGAIRMEAGGKSHVSYQAEIQPHAFYKVRARTRQMGNGNPELRVQYGDKSHVFTPVASPSGGWQVVEGIFRAPAQSEVSLVATGEGTSGSVIWFDDVELMKVSVN